MSDSQRLQQATAILQTATQLPYGDRYEAILYYYEALKVQNPNRFVIDPALIAADQAAQQQGQQPSGKVPAGAMPMPNPKMLEVQAKQMVAQAKADDVQHKAKMAEAELQMEAAKIKYEIALLSAQAAKAMAEAKGVDVGHQIAMLEAQIGAKNAHLDSVLKAAELAHSMIQTQYEAENADQQRSHERSMATMAPSGGNSSSH